MNGFDQYIKPSKKKFEADPFGYSSLGRIRWGVLAEMAGFEHIDIEKPATAEELKNPVLWLTQAEALSKAASVVITSNPEFENFPENMRGICDGQFKATGLMLVGYSLEICLKAMLIMIKGIDTYISEEKKHRHHKLHKLADFVPSLSGKDMAILELLTHYVYWAGRYPDPGYGFEQKTEQILDLAEKHQVTIKEVFQLAAKVMGHARIVANEL